MSNRQQPLISVLMTSYNREQYIAAAIESVLQSSYTHFELIITDDCSSDNTVSVARSYAALDSRIKLYINQSNLGDYPNRNRAASYAQGKYLKYLDADDFIYSFGLEVMVEYMERFPDAGFGLSYSKPDDIVPYPRLLESRINIRNEYLSNSYLGVGPSASIIKRDAFMDVGGFSGKQFIGDTELWLKMAAKYPMVLMNPALNWWRQHPGQQMKQEHQNPEISIKRLELSLNHLNINRHFFTDEEYQFALKRKKQHFSRRLWSDLLKTRNFKAFIYYYRNSSISLSDLVNGFRKYM